ncbi:hypothetical protein NC653_024562 [Populus alba x Populus x berolinensis]|uniref:Uncharacterized protein n=1 Tax=Populus alba x Populus x berolinensis TaxID=444605 RepID=A0AAD6MBG0_9ROSI|nr:hypothetical protein NC653_024562 [Populus alba x Populus x berolinensis]
MDSSNLFSVRLTSMHGRASLQAKCTGFTVHPADHIYGPEKEIGPTRNAYSAGTIIVDAATLQASAHAAWNACIAPEHHRSRVSPAFPPMLASSSIAGMKT